VKGQWTLTLLEKINPSPYHAAIPQAKKEQKMTKDQELKTLRAIHDAMWYLLNSGNPIQQAGLGQCLKPLDNVLKELEDSDRAELRKAVERLREVCSKEANRAD